MSDASDADDENTITYQFEADAETWRSWADCVPRSTHLHDRLTLLIEQDLRAARRSGYDEMEERTARLLVSRIKRRAQTAQGALDRDDEESAREHLEKIADIADTFAE